MEKIREWSFPVVLLTAWIAVAGYTLSSLGEAHARVVGAQKPAAAVPAVEKVAPVATKDPSPVRKPGKTLAHRGPRA